jgi:hypothetical protein
MQSLPMRESFRTHTLYFFQIVKDPNTLLGKNRCLNTNHLVMLRDRLLSANNRQDR